VEPVADASVKSSTTTRPGLRREVAEVDGGEEEASSSSFSASSSTVNKLEKGDCTPEV
jgi:hypothetical protein